MLRGKLTGLRAIEPEDLAQLLEWRNRPEYRRYFREYRELGMDQQKSWFTEKVLRDKNTIMFAIVELETEKLLGAAGLCYIDWVNRNADFSIYIGEDSLYIDEALATDAALVMINYAFRELGLHRVWTEIYEIDQKKEKMFRTLGFTREGRHRQTHWSEGRWQDSLFFSLLEGEFS